MIGLRVPRLLLATAITLVTDPAAAQISHTLDPGARVRVQLVDESRSLTGTILDLRPDTLLFSLDRAAAASRPLAIDQIDWIDISAGTRTHLGKGIFVGAITGALVGAAYRRILSGNCANQCVVDTPVHLWGLGGAVAGGLVGYLIRTDRWLRVGLPLREQKRDPPFRADLRNR